MNTFAKIGMAIGAIGVMLLFILPSIGYVVAGIGVVIMLLSFLFNLFK